MAFKPLRAMYGELPAAKFGPVAFQAVRQKMLEMKGARGQTLVGIGQDGYHFFGPVGASSSVAA
jgi:hypothetical protein